jgi:hypothetical protein
MDKYENFYTRAAERLGVNVDCIKAVHEAGLINENAVNMFLCLTIYPELKADKNKVEAVAELAKATGLSESYCRTVLGNYPQYIANWRFDLIKKREPLPQKRIKKSNT